jgi:hypothetical protein
VKELFCPNRGSNRKIKGVNDRLPRRPFKNFCELPSLRSTESSGNTPQKERDQKYNFLRKCMRPAAPPSRTVQRGVLSANGSSESIVLFAQVGSASSVLASQSAGSRPLILAVANKGWITAARLARREPANNRFCLPMASGGSRFRQGCYRSAEFPSWHSAAARSSV